MINPKIEKFLENHNMNYLFCLLSNKEVQRLNDLPEFVRGKFDNKLTEVAMEHVAVNEIPDYLEEIEQHMAIEEEKRLAAMQDEDLDEDDDIEELPFVMEDM